MKDGKLNINDLKKIANDKKFTNNIKNQSIDAIGRGGNMLLNKLTSTMKDLGK